MGFQRGLAPFLGVKGCVPPPHDRFRSAPMFECCLVCAGLALVMCVFVGPSLLIAGGIVYAAADCEELEVVGVAAIRAATRGIGMCDAIFEYSPRHLAGMLTTQCPSKTVEGANVAVCYSVAHPERYKVALLAEDLDVTPHSVPLILMGVGAAMTAIPLVCMLLSMVDNRRPRGLAPSMGLQTDPVQVA